MAVKSTRTIVRQLKQEGFDNTYASKGVISPRCSQCEALVINGMACHETGCPNTEVTS